MKGQITPTFKVGDKVLLTDPGEDFSFDLVFEMLRISEFLRQHGTSRFVVGEIVRVMSDQRPFVMFGQDAGIVVDPALLQLCE